MGICYRSIGLDEVIYQPLVVGGGDADGTYRADSFICAAAVHHGVFSVCSILTVLILATGDEFMHLPQDSTGGCLSLRFLADPYTDFIGSTSHGIPSVSFPSEFPFAFRFEPTSQTDCRDLRNDMLIFETIMSAAFGLLFRTSAGIFYWVSVCFGYWHITLASDPREFPRRSPHHRASHLISLHLADCGYCSSRPGRCFRDIPSYALHLLRLLQGSLSMGLARLQRQDLGADDPLPRSVLGVPLVKCTLQ